MNVNGFIRIWILLEIIWCGTVASVVVVVLVVAVCCKNHGLVFILLCVCVCMHCAVHESWLLSYWIANTCTSTKIAYSLQIIEIGQKPFLTYGICFFFEEEVRKEGERSRKLREGEGFSCTNPAQHTKL